MHFVGTGEIAVFCYHANLELGATQAYANNRNQFLSHITLKHTVSLWVYDKKTHVIQPLEIVYGPTVVIFYSNYIVLVTLKSYLDLD